MTDFILLLYNGNALLISIRTNVDQSRGTDNPMPALACRPTIQIPFQVTSQVRKILAEERAKADCKKLL